MPQSKATNAVPGWKVRKATPASIGSMKSLNPRQAAKMTIAATKRTGNDHD
jgi:hypothetical protein